MLVLLCCAFDDKVVTSLFQVNALLWLFNLAGIEICQEYLSAKASELTGI